jgi:hypothetical protein
MLRAEYNVEKASYCQAVTIHDCQVGHCSSLMAFSHFGESLRSNKQTYATFRFAEGIRTEVLHSSKAEEEHLFGPVLSKFGLQNI